jgi:hypothetical protein
MPVGCPNSIMPRDCTREAVRPVDLGAGQAGLLISTVIREPNARDLAAPDSGFGRSVMIVVIGEHATHALVVTGVVNQQPIETL